MSFPLSITISQASLILSTFFFLVESYKEKKLNRSFFPDIFFISLGIYLSLIPSIFANLFHYTDFKKIFSHSEISDFWMCFAILPSYHFYKDEMLRKKIHFALKISFSIILISGIISIFTPFRLGQFISNGFKVNDGDRLQHFAGDFFGRFTYLPLGMLNTHLSFGGILGLAYVGILIFIKNSFRKFTLLKKILYSLFILLFSILIFFNQSRSIWLGIFFSFVIYIYKEKINIKKIILPVTLILLIFFGVIYKKNWLIQRAFGESLKNSTENQRHYIYKHSLNIIFSNPIFGVGANRFSEVHKNFSLDEVLEKQEIWYETEITPRQHAHHDLIHFYSIGGIFSFLIYLLFWIYLLSHYFREEKTNYLFLGIFSIFIGGFFQCFILDDEVALPFFAFVGMFFSDHSNIKFKRKRNNTFQVESIQYFSYLRYKFKLEKKAIILIISFFIFSLSVLCIIAYKNNSIIRKIETKNSEDRMLIRKTLKNELIQFPTSKMNSYSDQIIISGCLTHYFNKKPEIRKDAFKIKMTLDEKSKNPPKYVKIFVYERDAFDQDKLYKVHTRKKLDLEFEFAIYQNENHFELKEIYSKQESKNFPDNIYFRDFGFFFGGFDPSQENFDFPKIDFGKNCN